MGESHLTVNALVENASRYQLIVYSGCERAFNFMSRRFRTRRYVTVELMGTSHDAVTVRVRRRAALNFAAVNTDGD